MSVELFKLFTMDKYDRQAVLVPTIICAILVGVSISPIVDWTLVISKFQKSLAIYSTVTLLSLYAILSLLKMLIRTISKITVEQWRFGKNLEHLPTTEYLTHNSKYGNTLIAEKVRTKVKEDFGITLKSPTGETKNPSAAYSSITAAVKFIKKKVQEHNPEMYNRMNRRYGQTRNLIGACYISALVSTGATILSYILGKAIMPPIISLGISIILALYLHFIYRKVAEDYANELFETYLTL